VKVWTERPADIEVESTIRQYFGLLRAGNLPGAAQLLDATDVRHVVKALWAGSAGAAADAGLWERDLSWLGELRIADDFVWGGTGSHVRVEVIRSGQTLDVELSFWVKPTGDGWVVAGPATLW
jgi:hypothetical protein